jgi:hypothetical protein
MQLDLFGSTAGDDVITSEAWPTSYRVDTRGMFVVTADVPGVGKIVARHRFLWEATCEVRRQVAIALAVRPTEMF